MILLLRKDYDGESMYDIYRDVAEAVTEPDNPVISEIPLDAHGFHRGTFSVLITWEDI
jgi:hypothetical protein